LALVTDGAFDAVLLNETIQQLHSPFRTVRELLRIAPYAVIGFPNFAYYPYRACLSLTGTLPVSDSLPYEWYDTPNIHLITIKDFMELCGKNGIEVEDIEFLSDRPLGRLFIALGRANLGAERAIVRIAR
jgi:homoserine O-acetyltransferase